jgi:hypothetical protein
MIADHHDDRLTAASDGKSGARFQFVLPVEPMEHEGSALATQIGRHFCLWHKADITSVLNHVRFPG